MQTSLIEQLSNARLTSSTVQKKKISALLLSLNSGVFDEKTRSDFPQSRLHAQLLVLGDTNLLYRMEKGEYSA